MHDDQSRGKGKGVKRLRTPSPTKRRPTLKAQARQEKKSTSLSQLQERLLFLHKNKKCEFWHLPSCFFHRRGQCRSGTNRPFVHIGKDDRPPSPTRQQKNSDTKQSNKIAKSKAGGNSLQVPNMEKVHAKGNLTRQRAIGHKKSIHWSAYDVKVAYS